MRLFTLFFVSLTIYFSTFSVNACPTFGHPAKNPDLKVSIDALKNYRAVRVALPIQPYSGDYLGINEKLRNLVREECKHAQGHLLFQATGSDGLFSSGRTFNLFMSFPNDASVKQFKGNTLAGLQSLMTELGVEISILIDSLSSDSVPVEIALNNRWTNPHISTWSWFEPGRTQMFSCSNLEQLIHYARKRVPFRIKVRSPQKEVWSAPYVLIEKDLKNQKCDQRS